MIQIASSFLISFHLKNPNNEPMIISPIFRPQSPSFYPLIPFFSGYLSITNEDFILFKTDTN